MGARRRAREIALQALFAIDSADGATDQFNLFCRSRVIPAEIEPYFRQLVLGVLGHRDQLDGIIESVSSNWKVSRMGGVDRNILRVATFELVGMEDVPPVVAINEAIEISKKFGTDESGAFVNGILDSIQAAQREGKVHFERRPDDQCLPTPLPVPPPPVETPEPARFAKTRVKKGLVRRREVKPDEG